MSMEINNTKMSEEISEERSDNFPLSDNNVTLSDNNNFSENRVFDDSKIAKLNGIRSQGLNPYPYKFRKEWRYP